MATSPLDGTRGGASPVPRRRFLQAAAAGAATVCSAVARSRAAEGPAASDATGWTMRLSTSSIHYLHLPIEEACRQIAAMGFKGIDIWSAHAGCPHLDDVQERLGADGLRAVLNRHGLKLFAFSVYRGGFPRYAELLGGVGGGVAVRGSTRPCPPEELVPRMKAFLESLKPEVELAEEHNAFLAIENHGNALLDSLDSFKAFVDLNRSPRVGIALAPYHLQGIGASVETAIATCGRQLLFFYAWQRGRGVEQLPGHGPVDFTPWLQALARVDYRGYVNPFMHGDLQPEPMTAALVRAQQHLEACDSRRRKG